MSPKRFPGLPLLKRKKTSIVVQFSITVSFLRLNTGECLREYYTFLFSVSVSKESMLVFDTWKPWAVGSGQWAACSSN